LNVTKDTAPFLILHGTKDEDVPIAQAEEFAAALKKVGVDATLETVDDGHAFTSEAARRLLAFATVAFFDRTLR
jgi:dipeptidyl aminopeptidase/acylaminoacyl peptidase